MFAPWLQAPITSSFTCKILSHNKSIIFPIRNSTQVGHSVHKLLALIITHHRYQQVDQPRNSCVANHSSVTSWTALQTFVTIVPISRLLSKWRRLIRQESIGGPSRSISISGHDGGETLRRPVIAISFLFRTIREQFATIIGWSILSHLPPVWC